MRGDAGETVHPRAGARDSPAPSHEVVDCYARNSPPQPPTPRLRPSSHPDFPHFPRLSRLRTAASPSIIRPPRPDSRAGCPEPEATIHEREPLLRRRRPGCRRPVPDDGAAPRGLPSRPHRLRPCRGRADHQRRRTKRTGAGSCWHGPIILGAHHGGAGCRRRRSAHGDTPAPGLRSAVFRTGDLGSVGEFLAVTG